MNLTKSGMTVSRSTMVQSTETLIMRLPHTLKGEAVAGQLDMNVEEAVDDPEEFSGTIIYQEEEKGDISSFSLTNKDRGDMTSFSLANKRGDMTSFSLTNIPIEVVEEETELASRFRLGLKEDLEDRDMVIDSNGEISDHVISIEENGEITIEQVNTGTQGGKVMRRSGEVTHHRLHSPPKFPEWWLRLSSTFLSYLSTGYMVDLWLVCCDGEAVPAHQLVFAHSSPTMSVMLAEARVDTQEEAVTLSLPDWDSDTVGQFVSALYQGQLPTAREGQVRVEELAGMFGVKLGKVGEGGQQVQVVQTDSGEILLVTCEGEQGSHQQQVEGAGGFDDEVEKVKAMKIAQIKEQQGKQCPACYNTAIQHRFSSEGGDQKFAYKCCAQDCGLDSLKTARAFNQHMSNRHGENVNYEPANRMCPLCFRPRIEHKNRCLSEEEKGNHRGNLYKCCHCAASKLSAKKFFCHMENHVAKKHICPTCGKGYSYKHLLNEHTWKEHGEGQHIRYPCNWEGCDYSAKYKQTLHTHVMERHHGVKRKHRQEDAYKKINCPTCNKSLKKWYYHQFHKKTCSSGNVIYQCEICAKEGFINAVTLQNHVRTKHSADRPFSCEYCPAKYATAMSLSGHRSRKHGVNSRGEVVPKKMFPCNQCGKLLTSKMKLQAHIEVIHEGRRDYKCRFCDKTFTSKSNLQIHEGSLHTGVLPYRCQFCQKMFARRSQLNMHTEAQHPGHAGPFFVVEDVDSVQVEDIIIPVHQAEEGEEMGGIMEGVALA